MPERIIVALTGASGAIYGVRTLEALRDLEDLETHLIVSKGARATLALETSYSLKEIEALADVVHSENNLAAPVSSGSFRVHGMIVAPCSVKTLSAIAVCDDGNLIARAADVMLKERRPLVLLFRETPLHAGHIRIMQQATEAGATLMPPVPAFYHRPQTIDDIVKQTVGRALDQLGLDSGTVRRWVGVTGAQVDPS
jgi:4-hydroxy-3-polyprenylbenzoate decarboxylase